MVKIERVGDDFFPWILAAVAGGIIVGFILLKYIDSITKSPCPPPINYNAAQTPFYSPYPYSPYYPTIPEVNTENAEHWTVQRDSSGNIQGLEIHRQVKER